MKKISKILLCFMILLLTSCIGSYEIKNYYGRKFVGKNGGEIVITEKVVIYSGEPSKINPNSTPEDINKAKDKMKKDDMGMKDEMKKDDMGMKKDEMKKGM